MKRLLLIALFILCNMTSAYAETGNIYIFISFSMSNESIKGWMNESKKIGAPVIIRGLVNNSFKDTLQKVSDLTHDNQGGVQLDPNLFRRFQIEKVPAVVVAKNESCLPSQTCIDEYDVIYGDVTLAYALKKIADKNDTLSSIALTALTKLRDEHAA